VKDIILDNAVLKIGYNVTIIIQDVVKNKVIKTIKKHNLITSTGKQLMAKLIGNESVNGVTYLAVGTDDTTVLAIDTELGNEVYRNQITQSINSLNKESIKLFLSSTQANGNDLVEAGLFGDNATDTTDSGVLVGHVTFEKIEKTSSIAVTFLWDITFN